MKILSFCYKREGNKSANEILVLEKLRLCTALNAISFGGLTEWFKVKKSDISVCVFKNQKRREALNLSITNAYWNIFPVSRSVTNLYTS